MCKDESMCACLNFFNELNEALQLLNLLRQVGQSISRTAGLVVCFRSAVVSSFQKWSKEGQAVNW